MQSQAGRYLCALLLRPLALLPATGRPVDLQLCLSSYIGLAELWKHSVPLSRQQQTIRFHSSSNAYSSTALGPSSSVSSPFSEEHHFVGAYTPVTKRLWQERLRMPKHQQQTEQDQSADASNITKQPQVTVVEYPFTTDKFLLEMVRPDTQ